MKPFLMKSSLIFLLAACASAALAADPDPAADIVITATPIDPARLEEEQQQLRRNLRQMRQIIEQESAQAAAMARGNTQGIVVNPSDSPSLGVLREQLARSMERLEDRCFGLDAKAENGSNVIVICGDNAGTAENANVRNSADTTVVIPPPPPPTENAPPAEEGKP